MTAAGVFYISISNFLGGSSYLAAEYALLGFSPVDLVFWRLLLASLLLLPVLWKDRSWTALEADQWLRIAAVGFFGYAAPLLIGTLGQELSTATKASLLIGIEPISIIVLSAMFLGEALSARKALCILGGLAGAALIVFQGNFFKRALAPDFHGDLLLFLHGFGWALYTVIGKPLLSRLRPLTYTALTTGAAALSYTLLAWPSLGSYPRLAPAEALAALVYLSAGVMVVGAWFWNKALGEAQASDLANFIFLQPLVGVLLGVLIQKETLTFWSVLGGGLILAGAYGSARRRPDLPPRVAEIVGVGREGFEPPTCRV